MDTIVGDKRFAALNEELKEFTQSELTFLRRVRPEVGSTEGVQHLADKAEVHWAVSAIAEQYTDPSWRARLTESPSLRDLHAWTVSVVHDVGGEALIQAYDAEGRELLHRCCAQRDDVPWEVLSLWAWWDGHRWLIGLASEAAWRHT